MKKLQASIEHFWQFEANFQLRGVVNRPENPNQAIILLHGLHERGRRIYRKLMPYLPQDALILAPNGPFPLPRQKEDRISYGFAWYFYDRFEKNYYIDQSVALSALKQVLLLEGTSGMPLTIIGFSQGGYLAPLLGKAVDSTRLIIGIGCEFRSHLVHPPLSFSMESIHGKDDHVVPLKNAFKELNILRQNGIDCGWHEVPETGHEINRSIGLKVKELMEAHGKNRL